MRKSAGRVICEALVVLAGLAIAAEAQAALHCTNPAVKLGDVRAGVPLAQAFELVNRGQGPLEIAELRPSCGCLGMKIDRRLLGTGDFTSLKLEINTLTQPAGLQTWRVQLICREAGQTSMLELSLTARVVTEVTVEPAALVVYTSTPITTTVTLRDRRTMPLTIAQASTTSDHVVASIDPRLRDEAGRWAQTVRLRIGPDYPEGRHDETLSLFTTDPDYRELRVPFKIVKQAQQRLRAIPAEVSVTASPGQPPPSRIVLLRGVGEEGVNVERVEADSDAIHCTWAQGPGAMATLKVSFDAHKLGAEGARGTVRVILRGPKAEMLVIPVACKVR